MFFTSVLVFRRMEPYGIPGPRFHRKPGSHSIRTHTDGRSTLTITNPWDDGTSAHNPLEIIAPTFLA
jgi:hypothetical protein